MTSGKYRVFSVPPQMSWQETGFSQSKGKSARKCVSADSPRSQLLSSDRKVTVGRLRGTEGTRLIRPTTEIPGLEWRGAP